MQSRRSQFPEASSKQGAHARGDRTTSTFSPSGRQRTGSLGPNTTTQGNPSQAARWLTPESLPT